MKVWMVLLVALIGLLMLVLGVSSVIHWLAEVLRANGVKGL